MGKWLFPVLLLLSANVHAALWSITYPRPIDERDLRNEYPLALLTLALEKTGVKYSLLPSDRIMLQGKALRQLRENREVNVVWSMTDAQREKDLLPVRIPLAKGLIGWRVFLINEMNRSRFPQALSKSALLKLVPISGEEWPDTKILQANGFNVFTVPAYGDAAEVLETNKADFFPRSVMEALNELEKGNLSSDIVLESNTAIYYPTALYFFVNKGNTTLARLIETGLQMAIEDGSFDALFLSTYEDTLNALELEKRTTIELDNPLLPPLTPVQNEALWYKPASIDATIDATEENP
ncbi:amino acid ABC transporter substrate-binding protein [Alteromonas sp. RKMC-009]|uniref:amino acid ABC transporter substrate-binding protein n=1 Tax=Alteromonas sp. RKMC-009 TaxID=2267264 RepID=UPI000E67F7D8|nr:amino acid ABC transporter substrate-binding protein [Alteromonas sp. RKMC-009]AYA63872.1 amino acid ABC transporter substrate-binding protein [Alteromonas sp. RKMC-009]